jgi:hypothetical protein
MKNKIAGKRDIESAFKLLCKSMPKSSYVKLVVSDSPMKAVRKLIERNEE